jgi:LPS-assembly protein
MEADRAEMRNRFQDGFAEHLRLLLTNNATMVADYAVRRDGYITVYDRVIYNRCATCILTDGSPLWQLRSREVTHNEQDHTIYHKDATFEFGGMDIVTLRNFSHPDPTVKRKTGFLPPTFGYGKTYGASVQVPYFINLAPNYDLTLLPSLTSKQGLLAAGTWRHRLASGQYYVEGAGLYQLDDNQPPPGDRRWRGAARSEGEFAINGDWNWGWDGTVVSDVEFMRRYDIDERDEIVNKLYLTGISDRNYVSAQALHFQGLLATDDQSELPVALPYVRYDYMFDQPIFGGEVGFKSSVYSLTRDEAVIAFPSVDLGTDQQRGSLELNWQRQMYTDMGQVITPFATLRGDLYYAKNIPDPNIPGLYIDGETTGRMMPKAGVDMRWPFIATNDLGQHILTPVAQLISTNDEIDEDQIGKEDSITLNFDDTSLFLHDRNTGIDQYEAGTRANMGLLYTFLAPEGGFARVSVGESFHIAGENSFLPGSGLEDVRSDLVGAITWQPWEMLGFSYQIRTAEDLSDVNVQQAGVSLTFDRISGSIHYVDVDAEPYYGRPEPEQQVWATAAWNFVPGWTLYGGARYDIEGSQMIKDMVGIGYDCDCFNFKLLYKEDYTNGGQPGDDIGRSIIFTVDLKSLTGQGESEWEGL